MPSSWSAPVLATAHSSLPRQSLGWWAVCRSSILVNTLSLVLAGKARLLRRPSWIATAWVPVVVLPPRS